MKLDARVINSKIGRRIFLMFGLCALLPILTLALGSYFQVSAQLERQSYTRMQKEAKAYGMGIYERLLFLESKLNLINRSLAIGSGDLTLRMLRNEDRSLSERFLRLTLLTVDLAPAAEEEKGISFEKPLTTRQVQHLEKGGTLLWTDTTDKGRSRIFMFQALQPVQGGAVYLAGQIEPHYLWGTDGGTVVSALTETVILNEDTDLLYESDIIHKSMPAGLHEQMAAKSFGHFDIDLEGRRYMGSFRLIFMQSHYLIPGWYVALCQPASYVFQSMATFRKTFPIVVLMSLFIVLLLSIVFIRKSLVPLDLLKTGLQSVAKRKFDHRIDIDSRDEFQELALHFNQMSGQLNQQFKTLNTRADIDRSILSSLNTKTIIETAVTGMRKLFDCDLLTVYILNSRSDRSQAFYLLKTLPTVQKVPIAFDQSDHEWLSERPDHRIFDRADGQPDFMERFADLGMEQHLVLPIRLEDRLAAVIVLANKTRLAYDEPDVVQARQMADQVGVALSNARLLRRLDLVNWGTLRAFARAVDAKSPWTAGHSERVAGLAVTIGRRMGLDSKMLDNLRRAAFLHDIGKIGISTSILDKPGRLTPEEYDTIKTHPDLGARILEPIPGFELMIPMIRQHHEKFAGGGYPLGMSGEEIEPCARILSVADVYDALISERPYRKGMPLDKALRIMTEESGTMFDPVILGIFLESLKSDNNLKDAKAATPQQLPSEPTSSAANRTG